MRKDLHFPCVAKHLSIDVSTGQRVAIEATRTVFCLTFCHIMSCYVTVFVQFEFNTLEVDGGHSDSMNKSYPYLNSSSLPIKSPLSPLPIPLLCYLQSPPGTLPVHFVNSFFTQSSPSQSKLSVLKLTSKFHSCWYTLFLREGQNRPIM